MSDLLDRLRRAARSAQEESGRGHFEAAGKRIVCAHCGHDEFEEGRLTLDSSVLTLHDLEWSDRTASILSCRRCGRVQWFTRRPDRP